MVMYNKPSQEMLQTFVGNNITLCQTSLVEMLFEKEVFQYEEIENFYHTEEEMLGLGYSKEEAEDPIPQEIYEWWQVNDYVADLLRKHNEPILQNEYGTWWGRTCTGQAIALDSVIETIFLEMMNS